MRTYGDYRWSLGLVVLLLLVGPPANSQDDSAADSVADEQTTEQTAEQTTEQTAEVPDYLRDRQELARERLAEDEATDAGTAATTSLRSGPVTGEEYGRFVERARFTGNVDPGLVVLTRPVVPRVVVHDRSAITYLFQCCAYDEASAAEIAFVEIYDLGAAGISNGDVLVTHPSGNSYVLAGLDPAFLTAASAWEKSDHQQYAAFHRETAYMADLVTELSPPDMYDWQAPPPDLPSDLEHDAALRAIWAGVHQAIRDQYGVEPLEIHFARDDTTTSLEVWGFEPDSLRFNYVTVGSGQTRNDLLTVTVRDTIFETLSSFLDVLVIHESRVDTVYRAAPADPNSR